MYLCIHNGEELPPELQTPDLKVYRIEQDKINAVQAFIEKITGEYIAENLSRRVRVQTFGNFEVFINEKPLKFHREKARELFAYLVDRHGASVTTRQIAAVLWEDAEYDASMKNKVTRTVSSLKKTLTEVGTAGLLVKTWNHLALDVSQISCDAFDFEQGDPAAMLLFRGEYMANYSWAEYTNGKYVQIQQKWLEDMRP